jgi:peptide deformylase
MAKLPIVTLPDPILRQVSAPIERVDAETLRLADDMLQTMYEAPGIGLAAIQVGVPRPLDPRVLINPEILHLGPETRVYEEGCLSIPDFRVDIERPSTLRLRYLDREGKQQEHDVDGLLATAIQHELDHLEGKLIIDFLSRLKRDMVVRKFKKLARQDGPI